MTREEALKIFEEENKDFEKIFERYGYQMSPEEVSAVKETIERNKIAISALSADGEYVKKEDVINRIRECAKEYKRGAKDSLSKGDDETFSWLEYVVQAHKNIEYGVEELPTYSFPDSAENKGEWIAYDHGMGLVYLKCPFCGTTIDKRHVEHNFCGRCGAKLSGEKSGFER